MRAGQGRQEGPGQPRIRAAAAEDVPEVWRLRAVSWRAAYAGLIPPAYLDAMDTGPEEIARAVRRFRQDPPGRHLLVAEQDGRIVAFACCGPERPMPEQLRTGVRRGEVYALYAHPEVWSTGVGGALFAAARERLRADGLPQTVLWVLEANARARAFYQRQGLHPTGARDLLRLGGALLTELQYGSPVAVPTVAVPTTAAPTADAPVPAPAVVGQRSPGRLTPVRRGV